MLVPREGLGEVEELAAGGGAGFAPGDPFDAGNLLGPLASAVQRDRVRGYISKGIAEGAKLVVGGAERAGGPRTGFAIRPTVFSEVSPDMTIAKEEIFGPVLTIFPYDTEEEAIAIANGSPYGLAGAVWSADTARGRSGWPARCAPGRSTSMAGTSTRACPSVATSSRASGASVASTASRSSSRPRRCSAKELRGPPQVRRVLTSATGGRTDEHGAERCDRDLLRGVRRPGAPTLLLVNGLGSQCLNYAEAWCRLFCDEGFHVVRFDNRDVGLSTKPEGAEYALADMADDAIAVSTPSGRTRRT